MAKTPRRRGREDYPSLGCPYRESTDVKDWWDGWYEAEDKEWSSLEAEKKDSVLQLRNLIDSTLVHENLKEILYKIADILEKMQ